MDRGYDPLTASKLYARAYRRLTKSVMSKGFNREFEAYMSLVSGTNFIRFDIKNDRLYYVNTGEEVSTENFERTYTRDRLSGLAGKYGQIEAYLQEYEEGRLTLSELNNLIATFKRTNQDYHKEGS